MMKKTYVTTMPNHISAFLKASECFAAHGMKKDYQVQVGQMFSL